MKFSKPIVDEVRLSFTGLDTEKGVIDVGDLTRALNGWRDFWEISTSVYLNKELSTKPLPRDVRPQIKIRAFEKNSFDVIATVVIPLTLMVAYDVAKALWKWRKSLLNRHVNSKKEFMSREEALEALKLLAKSFEIVSTSAIEIIKVLDIIDDALNDLVEPIDRSAKIIILTSSSAKSRIQLTSKEKRALNSGYHVATEYRSKDFEKHSVKFIRINTETGNSIITFEHPTGPHQIGHEYSKIIDPNVGRPRNIYTRALHEGTPLEVWGKMIRSRRSNKFVRWEISADIPSDDAPLFDTQKAD